MLVPGSIPQLVSMGIEGLAEVCTGVSPEPKAPRPPVRQCGVGTAAHELPGAAGTRGGSLRHELLPRGGRYRREMNPSPYLGLGSLPVLSPHGHWHSPRGGRSQPVRLQPCLGSILAAPAHRPRLVWPFQPLPITNQDQQLLMAFARTSPAAARSHDDHSPRQRNRRIKHGRSLTASEAESSSAVRARINTLPAVTFHRRT